MPCNLLSAASSEQALLSEDDLDSDQLWAAFDAWQQGGSDEHDEAAGMDNPCAMRFAGKPVNADWVRGCASSSAAPQFRPGARPTPHRRTGDPGGAHKSTRMAEDRSRAMGRNQGHLVADISARADGEYRSMRRGRDVCGTGAQCRGARGAGVQVGRHDENLKSIYQGRMVVTRGA
jgi:hypothetical protein